MKVSAVLTTYDRRELLLRALESVRAQTRGPDEIIVIDDGSADGTREAIIGQDIHYHWQANSGTSSARNKGWKLATGDWIAYLDSDDLWERDKLSLQISAAREDPKLEAIFGHASNFADSSMEGVFDRERHRLDQSLPCWLPGAALIRREVLDGMDGFDCSLQIAEAVDWVMKLRLRSTVMRMLPQVLLRRRLHAGNKQLGNHAQLENLRLLRRWREQQRERGN